MKLSNPSIDELTAKKTALQKQLNDIAKQEEKDFIARFYPEFKKLEGKCYKYKNSYGGDSKHWWLYAKIIEIKPTDVYDTRGNGPASHFKGYRFQLTSSGEVLIDLDYTGYVHSLGNECTPKEFNEAWNKIMDKLSKLS